MTQSLVKIIADFNTSLVGKVAVGATTATLASATDDDGIALPTGTYGFTIDRNNSSKEFFTATLTGTALTNVQTIKRGTGLGTAGFALEHRKGAEVIITDWVSLKRMLNILDGTTDLDSGTPLKYDGAASITLSNQLATKAYVDGVAIAGAPDASASVKGITKMSVAPVSATNPIAVGDNDPRVPTQNEKDALVGTSGTAVSSSNKLVDNADVDTAVTANKVVRRGSSGEITVSTTPTATTDASSKLYVDTQARSLIVSLTSPGGDGATAGSGNITLTGTNNAINHHYYSNLTVGSGQTLTVSTTGAIHIVHVSGNFNLSNGTVNLNGKGGLGGTGKTGAVGDGTAGSAGAFTSGIIGAGDAGKNAVSAAAAGVYTAGKFIYQNEGVSFVRVGPGGGGGGGDITAFTNAGTAGGNGGAGGGCIIFLVRGNFNQTNATIMANGANGGNATQGVISDRAGGGGGGGGGFVGVYYGGTLTGTASSYTATGPGGGAGGIYTGTAGHGGAGGAGTVTDGAVGGTTTTGQGGTGGSGTVEVAKITIVGQ